MSKYFTQDFMTLPRERRVEEMSTMLMRILCDADADTDANIAVVDRLLELRPVVASRTYTKATTLQERIQQFESAVEDAKAHVETLQANGVTDPEQLEYAYYDQLRKING